LKKLGHISEDGAQVLLKGRAMCEIDTADELLVTELMFHNAFAALSVPQLVALMSCFMQVEKSQDQVWICPGCIVGVQPARNWCVISDGCVLLKTTSLTVCLSAAMQIHLKDTLAKPLALLQETARTIGTLQLENKIELDVDEYVDGFKPTLMDIVYKWVNGISFAEISQVRGCPLAQPPLPSRDHVPRATEQLCSLFACSLPTCSREASSAPCAG